MLVDPDGLTAVDALVRSARERGLPTVVDGVEQPEQAVWLRDLGCDLAQGPWFGPPQDEWSTSVRTAATSDEGGREPGGPGWSCSW